jgi:hypothetical protein
VTTTLRPAVPLTLHVDPQGELREAALSCEAEVFLRWFGNTREQLQDEYGPYDESSVFIVVADDELDVKGACRIIVPGPVGLKTLKDIGREPWRMDGAASAAAAGVDPERTWDVGTLGVRRGQGGRGLVTAAALYHGLTTALRANRVQSMITILDAPVRALLDQSGIGLDPLPGTWPAPYLGSEESIPVYGHVAAWMDYHRAQYPDAHRLVVQGIGLDGITLPAPEDYVLRPDRVITLPAEPVVAPLGST